ncbi:hypothetical protein Tco_0942355, partial [Tanacetum coccineum]
GESLTTAPRPIGGHGADYGFIVWMPRSDDREPKRSAMALGMFRQTQIYQRVDILAEDRQFYYETNNMPPKRTSATARVAVAAAAPMTVVAVEQLIKARVSAALANHETL